MKHILIVEDEPDIQELLRTYLEDAGYQTAVAEDGVVVNLFLMIRYGFAIAEVAQKVQNAVYSALEGMTGFPVKAVNVHVGGISFD